MNKVRGALLLAWLKLFVRAARLDAILRVVAAFGRRLGSRARGEGYVAAARLSGLLYGALQLAFLFPALAITLIAREIGTSADLVQLVAGTSALGALPVTFYRLWRRAKLPPRWRLAAPVWVLGAALVLLGLVPSLVTFALALALAAAIGPSSMLVRDAVMSQFPDHRGGFIAVSQTWNYATRGGGGLAFALAITGILEVRHAIAALGCAVIAAGVGYACWSRLLGEVAAASASTSVPAPEPGIPLGRLLGSPSLHKALLATVGIYAAFQLLWAELQPRIVALGWSEKRASVCVAGFGLAVLVSIPAIRKYSRHSDEDATRSATEASRVLCAAAAFGLLTLAAGPAWGLAAIAAIGVYTAWIEIGGNATSAPILTGLNALDRRGVLLSSLARTVAAALGGVIAAIVGWAGSVWWTLGFAVGTALVLPKLEKHPVAQGWIEGDCERLKLRFEGLGLSFGGAGEPSMFSLEIVGRADRIGPWKIWRRDTVEAKTPLRPDVPRAERIPAFRMRFDWKLGGLAAVRRTEGPLFAGAAVPIVVAGCRRGTLRWRLLQRGHWRVEDGCTVLYANGLSDIELVHYRHGLA